MVLPFVKKVLGFFGFAKDDHSDHQQRRRNHSSSSSVNDDHDHREEERASPEGFTVKKHVRVPNENAKQGPVIHPCFTGEDGGVQGLKWYVQNLQIDEDGDFAEEFLGDVSSELPGSEDHGKSKVTLVKPSPLLPLPPKALNRYYTLNGNIIFGDRQQLEINKSNRRR